MDLKRKYIGIVTDCDQGNVREPFTVGSGRNIDIITIKTANSLHIIIPRIVNKPNLGAQDKPYLPGTH